MAANEFRAVAQSYKRHAGLCHCPLQTPPYLGSRSATARLRWAFGWITVLKKRDNYRKRFHQFKPEKVAAMTDADIADCLTDAGLIRHAGKLEAIRKNAKAWLAMEAQGIDMVEWLWAFVGNEIKVNHLKNMSEAQAQTSESQGMSKALKKAGFGFVGPTTCYAFMQSMGMVNDHMTNCPCHPDNLKA